MTGCRFTTIIIVVLITVFCLQSFAMACPTCKDGMGNDPERANLVRGYFWSILFMMSMPFLILTGIGGYFYYEIRKARLAQAAASPAIDALPQA